ncbi:MAG TPA: TasA family protein [Actinomycetota bacterium]|nr:TasA family protein [Actinomycetota bacterium]
MEMVGQEKRRSSAKVGLTLMVVAVLGAVVGIGTWSAFSSTTENSGNVFQAGTVTIGDNDGNSFLFDLSNLKPGDTSEKCIEVSYTGSLPASVKLYGTGNGSLGQYLTLTVTKGSITGPTFPSCTGFTPADGGGQIYSGNLSSFPASLGAALDEGTWNEGQKRVYRLAISVQDNEAAQGQSRTQSFTWDARSS